MHTCPRCGTHFANVWTLQASLAEIPGQCLTVQQMTNLEWKQIDKNGYQAWKNKDRRAEPLWAKEGPTYSP
jgi:hypothetical protein